MTTPCPCRHLCEIVNGARTVAVADLRGYRCGFEIAGSVRACPKWRRLNLGMASIVTCAVPAQLSFNL